MSKPDVIIGTCVYNRTWTLPNYFKTLNENTKVNYHNIIIVNYDELWEKKQAEEDIFNATFGLSNSIEMIFTPNLGLLGYNIPLEIGRALNVPVLLCNDDISFGKDWDMHLLKEDITTAMRYNAPTGESQLSTFGAGKEVVIDPKSIGCIGPVYVEPGCMKNQKFREDLKGYSNVDFVVGHAQLITREALRRGFTFDPNICEIFGPFDIYQSMKLLSLDLNILVSQECCFDFPESKESHFHNGSHEKFSAKFTPMWQKMQENLNKFQQEHIKKHGHNKWFF